MIKKALGRGLEALIPDDAIIRSSEVVDIELDRIKTGRYQPRMHFDADRQQELIESIREKGVVQPVIVRPVENGFELIAGERRFRAARALEFSSMPALIREVDDEQALELSIVENIQREDLNPIEEARAYDKLCTEFGLSQEDVARKVSRNRATVANALRLLKLSGEIQDDIAEGRMSAGHARAVLMVQGGEGQRRLRDLIVSRQLSVRDAERAADLLKNGRGAPAKKRKKSLPPELVKVEESLRNKLGTQVRLVSGRRKGRIEIEYYSHDDLERIMEIIGAELSM